MTSRLEKHGIPSAEEARARSKGGGFKFLESMSQQLSDAMNEGRSSYNLNIQSVAGADIQELKESLEEAGYKVDNEYPTMYIDWSDA